MINVGVIGLGMMGSTHLDVYAERDDVEVVAISDIDADRLHGRTSAAGNIDGQAEGGFNFASVKKYDEGKKLIRDERIDLVDICLVTPLHVEYACRALRAGKHVMVEKPVARTSRQAKRLVETAGGASGIAMVGMCMRFWPGWDWLKQAIVEQRYGRILSAYFRRLSDHPGGPFYSNGEACGGALLDLHIHDTDFIYHCLGVPRSVSSVGYSVVTDHVDHLVTRYEYDDVPVVVAEGGWAMSKGFGFHMQYTVNFQEATARFDLGADPPLTLNVPGQQPQAVPLRDGMGYTHEIDYMVDCIKHDRIPQTVTVADAAISLKIAEAEERSVANRGKAVKIKS